MAQESRESPRCNGFSMETSGPVLSLATLAFLDIIGGDENATVLANVMQHEVQIDLSWDPFDAGLERWKG